MSCSDGALPPWGRGIIVAGNRFGVSAMSLPAICTELRLRQDGNVPVVNSRDVADLFEKRHNNVLRDIEALEIYSDLSRSWFRSISVTDSYGREQPSFNMTRQGFTLLVMGWTGERATAFKVRYIEAFDAMEATLRSPSATVSPDHLIQAVREIVAPLAIRFDGHDRAFERVERRVDGLSEDVAAIKFKLLNGRRNLSASTKREHENAIRLLGDRCPCCGENAVVNERGISKFAQYDHFYANSHPNAEHLVDPGLRHATTIFLRSHFSRPTGSGISRLPE